MILHGGPLILLIVLTNIVSAEEEQLLPKFSRSNINFATNFYLTIAKDNPDKNVIISPFSVQVCGAMQYSGTAGKTADEMTIGLKLFENNQTIIANAFELALKDQDSNSVQLANKMYLKKDAGLKPEFVNTIKENYQSEEENIDFADGEKAAEIINKWVENATYNKVKDIVQADDFLGLPFMVLVNTIYFKAEWEVPFWKRFTKKSNFWISENKTKEVEIMSVIDIFNSAIISELNAEVIQLNYKIPNVSMLVIIPKERFGLQQLEEKLTEIDIIQLQNKLLDDYIYLYLPKFKIEESIDLKESFKKMGMGSLFESPDFSNMLTDPQREAKVSKAVHKAFIEIDEWGTEAGAGTASIGADRITPRLVNVDHPFIFVVISKSAVLFMGRYIN